MGSCSWSWRPGEWRASSCGTDANLPQHEPSDVEPWRYGPTGVTDAAMLTLLNMAEAAIPVDQHGIRPDSFKHEVDRLSALADRLAEPEWSRKAIVVDEGETPFWVRIQGECWVAADLGIVSLGLFGSGLSYTDYALVPVNSRIDDYQTDEDVSSIIMRGRRCRA